MSTTTVWGIVIGVAVIVGIVLVMSQYNRSLKSQVLAPDSLVAVGSPTASPVAKATKLQCNCGCSRSISIYGVDVLSKLLCAVPYQADASGQKYCSDFAWEFGEVATVEECEGKEGAACEGYEKTGGNKVSGTIQHCQATAT